MGRFWFSVKVRVNEEDHTIEIEVRQVSSGENVGKQGGEYYIRFGEIEVKFGEDLLMRVIELFMYMLPEEFVQRMIREYCEMRLRWI